MQTIAAVLWHENRRAYRVHVRAWQQAGSTKKPKEDAMKRMIAGVLAVMIFGAFGVAAAADGAALYKTKCQACHGADGKGTAMAPAFTGNSFVKDSTDEQVAEVIIKGRKGADKHYKQFAIDMPPQKISPEEARELTAYLKGLAAK